MGKSLQEIEDSYIERGLSGKELRKALEKDKDYQKLLTERKEKLTKKFEVSQEEEKKYVLSTDKDYEILGKIHLLEKQKLSPEDKRLIKFIRTQLQLDWRASITKQLDELLEKYKRTL